MGDVLGEGSYAKVKEAIDSETLVSHLQSLFWVNVIKDTFIRLEGL